MLHRRGFQGASRSSEVEATPQELTALSVLQRPSPLCKHESLPPKVSLYLTLYTFSDCGKILFFGMIRFGFSASEIIKRGNAKNVEGLCFEIRRFYLMMSLRKLNLLLRKRFSSNFDRI